MAETTPALKRIVKRYRIQLQKMGIHPTRVLLYSSQASATTHEGSDILLEHEQMPEGNKLFLQKGAPAFPHPFKGTYEKHNSKNRSEGHCSSMTSITYRHFHVTLK